ncbi:MAG: tetratricopeptide repeat-containing sensor histidine kinase [Bacteroidota bacterium]|nr:tetratricopeptide repeat-containing sensor histidine kinase [Bacteroidota bacterium]
MNIRRWFFLFLALATSVTSWSAFSQDSVKILRLELDNMEPASSQYLPTIIRLCEIVKRTDEAYLIPGLKTKGLIEAESRADTISMVRLYNLLGDYYWRSGLLTESAEEYNKIRILAERSCNDEWKALSFNGIGTVYYLMTDYSKALKYYQQGAQIVRDDSVLLMKFYNNIANVYSMTDQMDSVLFYYNLVLKYDLAHGDLLKLSRTHNNLSLAYSGLDNRVKASEHAGLALDIARKANDPYLLAVIYEMLAVLDYDNNTPKAVTYFKEAIKYAETIGSNDRLLGLLERLVNHYQDNFNTDSSYFYLVEAYLLRDSLETDRKNRTVNEIESSFDWAMKQMIIERETYQAELEKQSRNSRQKNFLYVMGIVLLALVVILYFFFRTNRIKASINRQLEASNATKDKFFSLIAHDLRGPLSGAIGLSEVVRDKTNQLPDSHLSRCAISLNNSINDLYGLTENLLTWAQTESGRISFEPTSFNIHELANEAVSLSKELCLSKGISISNTIPIDLILTVDKNMISTIFRNLISNSLKYTDSGGQIVLSSTMIKGFVQIIISDTGCGISAERVKSLFDPGKVYTTLGTRNERGSGLGLLLCKEFVNRHQGSIRVESQLGKGTRIIMDLPAFGY